MAKGIELVGLRELNRAVRKAVDTDLGKRMGQANKRVGTMIVDRWLQPKSQPSAVGSGRAAQIRPSASKREVVLRTGGAHRAAHAPMQQWGKKVVNPFRPAPPRPDILGSAVKHRDEITSMWMEAIAEAMDPAFYETSVR